MLILFVIIVLRVVVKIEFKFSISKYPLGTLKQKSLQVAISFALTKTSLPTMLSFVAITLLNVKSPLSADKQNPYLSLSIFSSKADGFELFVITSIKLTVESPPITAGAMYVFLLSEFDKEKSNLPVLVFAFNFDNNTYLAQLSAV